MSSHVLPFSIRDERCYLKEGTKDFQPCCDYCSDMEPLNECTADTSDQMPKKHRNSGPKLEDLSRDEAQKLKVKRERNKEAAVRCRRKRKDRVKKLLEEIEQLEDDNQQVYRQIRNLELQRASLQKIIREHDIFCGSSCLPLAATASMRYR